LITDLFAWLLATFVIGPVQAELADRMQSVQAPAAIVQQVQTCILEGTPKLAERAASEPWWGITTVISVSTGFADAQTVLAEASPECAAAVAAVKPFLTESGASETGA
jgi:hypothetical protein